MSRIIAIDFGLKRSGIAVTDPLQIIATGLTTIDTKDLMTFLKIYVSKESVVLIIIGEPKNLNGSDTHATKHVRDTIEQLKKEFPAIPVKSVDERFTSKLASAAMIQMGLKKKDRQNKKIIDQVAATIILQEYLMWIQNIGL